MAAIFSPVSLACVRPGITQEETARGAASECCRFLAAAVRGSFHGNRRGNAPASDDNQSVTVRRLASTIVPTPGAAVITNFLPRHHQRRPAAAGLRGWAAAPSRPGMFVWGRFDGAGVYVFARPVITCHDSPFSCRASIALSDSRCDTLSIFPASQFSSFGTLVLFL